MSKLFDWLSRPRVVVTLPIKVVPPEPAAQQPEPKPQVKMEGTTVDSFVQWITTCWGQKTAQESAAIIRCRETTIQTWMNFTIKFITDSLMAGKPAPTQQQIIDEWHKTNPPAQVVATPFGDTFRPVSGTGGGSMTDLVAELKEVLSRYGG